MTQKAKFNTNKFRCVWAVLPAEMYRRGNEETTWTWPHSFQPWVCFNVTVSNYSHILTFHGLSWDCFFDTSALFFSRVTMIENLSNASFKAVLDHIHANFADFLRMPHYKQTCLAEKAKIELVKHQHEPYQYRIYCIFSHGVQGLTH